MLSPEGNFQITHERLRNIFMAEVRGFDATTRLPEFQRILRHVGNYREYLQARKGHSAVDQVLGISQGIRVVEVANMAPAAREIFCTAHFAACCVLLDGFQINLEEVAKTALAPRIREEFEKQCAADSGTGELYTERLIGMDATRTMLLLKSLGLITRESGQVYQLALGAGSGNKDINYLHAEPSIHLESGFNGRSLVLGSLRNPVSHIVVSDLDPRHQAEYDEFANLPASNATGYVSSTDELLEMLPRKGIRRRNLVSALRIEPAMIPDAKDFLGKLSLAIDDDCDFVLSIGAGDTPEAYQRRLDVIDDMSGSLLDAGLEPVLIRLHLGGSAEEQSNSLQFGSGAASSYEILYCKLDNKVLGERFRQR